MATSLVSSGLAAARGSSSSRSGASQSHRPCALALPSNGTSSASSSSKLLDELAEVACSPESPLMKAVQAVWPDFNLSPLEQKTISRRKTSTSVPSRGKAVPSPLKPPSPVKTPGPVKASSNSVKAKSGRQQSSSSSRVMSSNAHGTKAAGSIPVVANGGGPSSSSSSQEEVIERFADIPSAALRCFQGGSTTLSMHTAEHGAEQWISTEVLRQEYPQDAGTSAASKDLAEMTRLRVVDCHAMGRKAGDSQDRVKLTFLVMPTVHQIVANCLVSHPFLVEKKGWTSLDPGITLTLYGLSCQQLSLGDMCVPPVTMEESGIGREEIMPTSCGETSSEEYSDGDDDGLDSEESQAARLLSQLATGQLVYPNSDVEIPEEDDDEEEESPKLGKRRSKKRLHEDYYEVGDLDAAESEDSLSEDYEVEAKPRPAARKKATATTAASKRPKATKKKPRKNKHQDGDGDAAAAMKHEPGSKRPMNAFMLFAQKYRQEVTRQHPGKDNRAISTLLGTYWKELDHQQRVTYVVEARSLAQQHQKLYPNCWKRKRTNAQAAAAAAASAAKN